MPTPANAEQAIQAVGHILNTVDIPVGISRSQEGKQVVSDFTQSGSTSIAVADLPYPKPTDVLRTLAR